MEIKAIFKKYKIQFVFTLLLILLEAGIALLFPLFIGYAIDSVLSDSNIGVIQLGLLGFIALIIGVGRRVFDSRFYAKVYQDISTKTICTIENHRSSVKAARLGMIGEFVEFLENTLPVIITNVIGLLGVMIILASLNMNIFYGSLIVSFLIFLIYWFSSFKTIQLNKSSNDEAERQVDVIAKNDERALSIHLKKMMKWNIKLSDLEALNFSVSWVILILFLILSISISASAGIVKYGALFSLIVYVFQYMENVISLPLFYQNWLRLTEINERINSI